MTKVIIYSQMIMQNNNNTKLTVKTYVFKITKICLISIKIRIIIFNNNLIKHHLIYKFIVFAIQIITKAMI